VSQTQAPRGFIGSFFSGAWRAFNGIRRFVFGLIAIAILVVLFNVMMSGPKALEGKTALVIPFRGALVEQFSGDPSDAALNKALGQDVPETRLRDIKRALELAAKDGKIDRVLLRTDELAGGGQASLREVARYLTDFKKNSGKEVLAYAYNYDQRALFIAAHADKIYMHPEGLALLEGLGRNRMYYASALQKLGVKFNVFRVGKYKSAVEPYLLDGQSAEAREADAYWLNDLWDRFLVDYAALRKTSPEALKAMIDQLPERLAANSGELAQIALSEKLIDELKTPDELRALMLKKGAAAEKDDDEAAADYRKVGMQEYLALNELVNPEDKSLDAVAVIVAEGGISDGKRPQGEIGGDSTAALIRQARDNKRVKAVVLRVNSPGGSGFASEVIRRELEITRAAGKPVYISMGDLAASGGYWISMAADAIYASPSTITGSIGIFGLFPNATEGLDKVGVHSDGYGTTWLATAFDPARPLDPRLGEAMQLLINNGYQSFIGKVAQARKQTVEQINEVAQGRVWSGSQAKERGLVDAFGTLDDVVAAAAKKANLSVYRVSYVEKKADGLAAMLSQLLGASVREAAELIEQESLISAFAPAYKKAAERELQLFKDAADKPFTHYAHCLCTAD
jgi:protease IV